MMKRLCSLVPFLAAGFALYAAGCGGTPTTPQAEPEPPPPPRAVVRQATTLDAGEIDYVPRQDYTFPVANEGGAPLSLKLLRKSCTCADVEVPDEPLPPGGAGVVALHWSPLPGVNGPERLDVALQTNDPEVK